MVVHVEQVAREAEDVGGGGRDVIRHVKYGVESDGIWQFARDSGRAEPGASHGVIGGRRRQEGGGEGESPEEGAWRRDVW